MVELNKIYNMDCLEGMKQIENCSIDCVCTDPPYLYLKNQKLDRPFDETAFFSQVKRILKPEGFVVLFGRGTSFYRWNTILADLGFKFKEEIIWDKYFCTSPLQAISRVHETISLHSISGKIIKIKIPYIEAKEHNIDLMLSDLKRIISGLNSKKEFVPFQNFFYSKKKEYDFARRTKTSVTVTYLQNNMSPSAETLSQILIGTNEKSIISIPRKRFKRFHPTEKPSRLIERLLALCVPTGGVLRFAIHSAAAHLRLLHVLTPVENLSGLK